MSEVYILQSITKDKYYIGSTANPQKRLKHHKEGHTPSTKRLGEMTLVFHKTYPTLKEARAIEKRLKKLKRRDYIEKIIEDGYIKMKL